jgi:hypothetical protein
MITMQTNLSAMVAVTKPAGGEMSGPKAHFLFGGKIPRSIVTTRGRHSGSKTAEQAAWTKWQSSWTKFERRRKG